MPSYAGLAVPQAGLAVPARGEAARGVVGPPGRRGRPLLARRHVREHAEHRVANLVRLGREGGKGKRCGVGGLPYPWIGIKIVQGVKGRWHHTQIC